MSSRHRQAITPEQREKIIKRFREIGPETQDTLSALHSLAQHWVENETLIERAAAEEVKQSGPKWTPKDDEDISEFLSARDIARMMHDDIMFPMHRYSSMVMLYSTVERELKRLVENLGKGQPPQKLKLNDIRGGSYLAQVAKFVDVFYNLRLVDCPQFAALDDLRNIRNCIIHCLGEVDQVKSKEDKDYLLKLDTKRNGFYANRQNAIWMKPECIKQFIIEIWSFFTWVFTKLDWKIDSFYTGDKLERTLKQLK